MFNVADGGERVKGEISAIELHGNKSPTLIERGFGRAESAQQDLCDLEARRAAALPCS